MKKLFIIALFLTACEEWSPAPAGCVTAISKDTGEREFIRCETLAEFRRKDALSENSDNKHFTFRWENCDQCK